jgi:hypothetical protein
MTLIRISPWRSKPNRRPRYSVYDGREPLGTVFESRGVFSAIDADGNLVVASTSVQIAANALVPTEASS